jgi:hypothetical protein
MTTETEDKRRVYYSPSQGTIDLIRADGLTWVNGQTAEQVRQRYPDAIEISLAEAAERSDAKFRSGPVRITGKFYKESLGVLPPEDWQRRGDTESFKISERTSGSITAIYCALDGEYWTLSDSFTLSHDEIVKRVRERRAELLREHAQALLDELRKAQAALPDAWFAVKCNVPRELVDSIGAVIRKAEGWPS